MRRGGLRQHEDKRVDLVLPLGRKAEVYKQVLSLLLAERRPHKKVYGT